MSASACPDHPVLLPSNAAWNQEARMVGDTLGVVGSAAAVIFDDTHYLLPMLTWKIASGRVGDCVTTGHRPEHLRVLLLPPAP